MTVNPPVNNRITALSEIRRLSANRMPRTSDGIIAHQRSISGKVIACRTLPSVQGKGASMR